MATPPAGEGLTPLQQALLALKEMQRRLHAQNEPIAVVGMGCRLPGGVSGTEAFWQLLCAGTDTTREVPRDRWDADAFHDPDPAASGKVNVRRGAFLDDIRSFDAGFFNISPREASRMDPQQRLLLEVVWEALEDAGQPADELVDSQTGVFVSGAPSQYLQRFSENLPDLDAYAMTGNIPCTLSGRVSYVLGLRGPNIFLDTGCSASLVAIHLACNSLRGRECDLALAGGVNIILSPEMMVGLGKTGALSPDGRCKTFDASANGFARGEGCGVVVLKRLSDAVANGDRILAVVRGSAVNHDGRSSGLTVPSGPAQQQLIRKALETAQANPQDIGFVESHGTGTELGDPIEVGALAAVYGRASGRKAPLLLGATKSNLGHLEAAAGVAGFIKAALCVARGQVPPNVHLREPNPKLPLEGEPFSFPNRLTPWPTPGRRLAAVSSFGLGGTNAHLILEEPPAPAAQTPRASAERPVHVLSLSARSGEALVAQARQLSAYLAAHSDLGVADVCHSANRGRARLPHRLAVVASSMEELRRELDAYVEAPDNRSRAHGLVEGARRPKIAFLFTGQGSQYAGMGRELYETQPVFREAIDRCAAFFDKKLPVPLTSLLLGGAEAIDQTGNAQPALFALQYALSELWRSWGITPDAVVGHSVGEIAAAWAAKVLTFEDAALLVTERARRMQALPAGGSMVALRASPARVQAAIAPYAKSVSIAALNGPDRVVISGESAAVSAIAAAFTAEGVEAKELRVSHAFHSPAMDPVLEPFQSAIQSLAFHAAKIPWLTNVTGKPVEKVDAAYWARQIRAPVHFGDAVTALATMGCELLIEIGPHPTLLGLAAESLPEDRYTGLPSLRRGQPETRVIAQSVARLFTAGAPIDWRGFDAPYARRRVPLPTYPFQRQVLWVEKSPATAQMAEGSLASLAGKLRGELPDAQVALFQSALERLAVQHRRVASASTVEGWCHRIEWRESPRRAVEGGFRQPGHWILFADRGGVAEALARQLTEQGETCRLVRPEGGKDLAEAEELERLLANERQTAGRPIRGVIHLWSLDAAATDLLTDEALEQAQQLGCGSALHLVQALARGSAGEACRLWLVTREAAEAGGRAKLAVAQAPLWGLASVIAIEHPELWGGAIDLEVAVAETQAARLLAELREPEGEDRIAWRDGRRLVAGLAQSAPRAKEPLRIRPDATYLITGGLGELGLAAARWLVERGARYLALLGRSQRAQASATIEALERAGATVRVLQADVSERRQLDAVLTTLATEEPPLRGIIHAAGVVEDALLPAQRWDAFARVLAPKVRGAWNLHSATRDLDFFINFSSVSSLLGAVGQGNYAAGNAFLDALAHHRRAEGQPGLSIHWGPWEVGMVARMDEQVRRRTFGQGWSLISVEQGIQALDAVAASGDAEVAILPVDWSAIRRESRDVPPLIRELVRSSEHAPAEKSAPPRRLLEELGTTAALQRTQLLENGVQRHVKEVLGLKTGPGEAPLDRGGRFVELGMDSLMAVELKNRLQRELDVRLSPTAIFNHPSVRALTAHLVELLAPTGLFPSAAPQAPAPAEPPAQAAPAEPASEDLSEDALIDLIARKYESRR